MMRTPETTCFPCHLVAIQHADRHAKRTDKDTLMHARRLCSQFTVEQTRHVRENYCTSWKQTLWTMEKFAFHFCGMWHGLFFTKFITFPLHRHSRGFLHVIVLRACHACFCDVGSWSAPRRALFVSHGPRLSGLYRMCYSCHKSFQWFSPVIPCSVLGACFYFDVGSKSGAPVLARPASCYFCSVFRAYSKNTITSASLRLRHPSVWNTHSVRQAVSCRKLGDSLVVPMSLFRVLWCF